MSTTFSSHERGQEKMVQLSKRGDTWERRLY